MPDMLYKETTDHGVVVRATEFQVCVLSPENPSYRLYVISVVYRGNDLWAVFKDHECLNVDGEWSYEPAVSGREGEWLTKHRFDLDTALKLAKAYAPNIRVNGLLAKDVPRWQQEQREKAADALVA